MISKCFVAITLISVVYALFTGNFCHLANSVIDGAAKSVSLSIELCGMACLWCGIMQVFMDSGILDRFCRIMTPVLGRIFPESWKNEVGKREIVSCISANILGIGNAATPYAISAMRELDRVNPDPETTTDDMATFAILGTASPNLVPTTLIALRRAAGSAEPYSIIVPVWIASVTCTVLSIIAAKVCSYSAGRKKKNARR